jgi:hypothetical protein
MINPLAIQTAAAQGARRRLIPGVGMPGAAPLPAPSLGFRPPTSAPGDTGIMPFNGPMVNAQAPSRLTPPTTTGTTAPAGWLGRAIAGAGGPSATPAGIDAALPSVVPSAPASTPLPATPTKLGYGTSTTIDPNNDLRSQVIAPGTESSRADLAKTYLDMWSQNELPQFRAALRGTIGNNAALGRLGSGMLRTDVGNLDLAEQQKYNTAAGNFMTDALGAQITDNANQRAELRGERSYQTSAEQAAADRARQQLLDQDYLTNSRFGRSATALQLGTAGNPSGAVGQAASDAGARAAAGASAVGSALGSSNYLDLLRKILAQQGGATTPTPTGTVVRDPTYPS